MDLFRSFNITHPRIQGLQKYSLYHSQLFRHTLTNNEFIDNVLVAISLFVLVILLKDAIARIVYMRPRFSTTSDTLTYFSQARIVLLDNNFLLRWVRQFQLFDEGHYNQRNRMHYNLVGLATLALFVVELGLVVPGLPANRPIYRDVDKMVRWESKYLDQGSIILQRDHICNIAPVLEGPHLKSESSWSSCQLVSLRIDSSANFTADKMRLIVSNPEKIKGTLKVALFGEGLSFESAHVVYIPVQKNKLAVVGLSDDASTLARNLQRNFDLLRNVTGIALSSLSIQDGNYSFFHVNASHVKRFAHLENTTKVQNAGLWVSGMTAGVLSVNASNNGSQFYEMMDIGINSTYGAVPLKEKKILIGAYIGTLVPAFFVVAFTACSVLAHIVVCIVLRAPPGGAWELIQAHGRHNGDRILAGPPGDVVKIQQ